MNEQLMSHIWQFQLLNSQTLSTDLGDQITLFHQGHLNMDSGPDFKCARLRMHNMEWHGHIELHVKSSDWYLHGHHHDAAYNSVILHVVWTHDQPVYRQDGSKIPTLILGSVASPIGISSVQKLLGNRDRLPCRFHLPKVTGSEWSVLLRTRGSERLQDRVNNILSLVKTGKNWNEAAYHTLFSVMGFSVNTDAFRMLSSRLPFNLVMRHANELKNLEAILFGMSGWLSSPPSDYLKELASIYAEIEKKHGLPPPLPLHIWQFGRMRPASFPTLRLAQLAALLHNSTELLKTFADRESTQHWLRSSISAYWQLHHRPGVQTKRKNGGLGKTSRNVVIANVVVPILMAYDQATRGGSAVYQDWLISIEPEQNRWMKLWPADKQPENMLESQGILQLSKNHCFPRRCRVCSIGQQILRTAC